MTPRKLISNSFFKNYFVIVAFTLFSMIVTSVGIAIPWILKDIVDIAVQTTHFQEINKIGFKVLFLTVILYVVYFIMLQLHVRLLQNGMYNLRKTLYNHIMKQPLAIAFHVKTGEIMHHLKQDTDLFETKFDFILSYGFYDVFAVLGILGLMFYTSPIMACVILAFLITNIIITVIIGRPLLSLTNLSQSNGALFNSKLQDLFTGLRTVKTFGQEQRELENLDEINQKMSHFDRKIGKIESIIDPISYVIEIGGLIMIIWFGSYLITKNLLTAGQLIAFLLYIEILSDPFNRISKYVDSLRICYAVLKRMTNFMQKLTTYGKADLFEGKANYSKIQKLSMQNIHFKYDEKGRDILKDINFTANVGEITAIVGHNGAGKTTIVDLIIGIKKPQDGEILANDVDIYKLKESDWRKHVGLLTQDMHLFNDSILNNIKYGKPDATQEEIDTSVKKSNLTEIISKLPNGLDTIVGEKGNKFSGGERQKITLARIFLLDPDLIIFDEPSNHLDSKAVNDIVKIIKQISTEKVVIIIEHRLEVLKKLNPKVVFIDNGNVVAVDEHDKLFAKSQKYQSLFSQ